MHVFRHLDLDSDNNVSKDELAVFLRHLFSEQLKVGELLAAYISRHVLDQIGALLPTDILCAWPVAGLSCGSVYAMHAAHGGQAQDYTQEMRWMEVAEWGSCWSACLSLHSVHCRARAAAPGNMLNRAIQDRQRPLCCRTWDCTRPSNKVPAPASAARSLHVAASG